jgi:predicted nuclease of predicted toxin-antitoxin system
MADRSGPSTLDRLVSDEAKDFMLHVAEVGLADASDAVILDYAREEGRVIVTLDADFRSQMRLCREQPYDRFIREYCRYVGISERKMFC